MTGNPFYKTRVILSEELELKLAGRRDYDAIAIAFKHALVNVASRPTLDAGYSIKALANITGSETYKDTDNKKRTNTGAPAGLVEEPGGIRYIENQKWEPGRSLYLTPSRNNTKRSPNKPNFGWLEDPKSLTPTEYVRELANRPKIRYRKYKVNPKTNEIIQESEQQVDQFSLNGNATKYDIEQETKRLPGSTIGSRGRSLLQRAASAFGVIIDEANKFRCPPGTPAANQFTDSMGSNCFGISANEMVNRALDAAKEIGDDSQFRNNVRNFFNFLSFLDNGGIPGLGRTVWTDENGKRIRNIKKWREASRNDANSRLFVNGMIRAQERLKQQDKIVSDLMDELEVVRTPEKMKTNEDLFEALAKLRASGAWTVDITGRPTKEEIDMVIAARLQHVPGFSKLSEERKAGLIKADTERYYETERAVLEAALDSFVADPEHMRTVNDIFFRFSHTEPDEANSSFELTDDTKRLSARLTFDIPRIMRNQEAMLPHLAPNERLRIDVVGAKTDSEAASELSDFLVTVDGSSKQLAAMVEPRAFARHISKHEIAHTIQMAAFTNEIKRQIETNGFIQITRPDGQISRVTDIKDLNSGMIMYMMKHSGEGIDVESMKNALSRTDVVAFLAGDYPKQFFFDPNPGEGGVELWVLEAAAELHALRDLGLIYGDDIDAALEWMDDVSDGKYLVERVSAVEEGMEKIKESYYLNLGPDKEILGETVAVIKKREIEERKDRKKRLEQFSLDASTSEEKIVKELSINQEERELLKSQLDAMESAGIADSDPDYRSKRDRVKQIDEDDSILKRAWNDRFGSPAKEDSGKNKRKLEKLIDDARETAGTLDKEKLKTRVEEREKKASKELADSLDADGIIRKLADQEILLKDPSTSKEEREKIKRDQKIFREAYKKLLSDSGDDRTWAQQRRELEKKIYDIVVPETERVIGKPKKFKTERSSGNFASKKREELESSLTEKQVNALAELEKAPSDESAKMAEISMLLDPKEQVYVAKQINRRHRKAQRGAAEIDGDKTDNASLEQQIENVLIPALEAFETSRAGEDFEVDIFVDPSTMGDVQDRVFIPEITKYKLSSEDVTGSKEMTRVKIQVAKNDKVVLTRGDAITKDPLSGHAIFPPGMTLRVVDRQEDGTIIARIEKQENMADTLQRLSNSFDETMEGPSPSQHAKGTKKKVDKVINKYVAQRKQNGFDTTPSQPKPSPAIESRNNTAVRTVKEAGGSFGEPPLDDYVAEVTKTPLVQPAEKDIKPDPIDARTGRPVIKSVGSMSVEEILNRRAATYSRLLDPDYANDAAGFQNVDRGTLKSLDAELVKRGEIVSSLPQPPEFKPDHVPGSKKRSPYKTSSGNLPEDMNSGAEAIGKAQTREQRASQRRKKVESTVDAVKDVLTNKSSDEILPAATKESVDPAVARMIFETPLEKIAEQIEKSAVEFHEGIDKRPRVRMTESQLDSFIESGEFLPDDPDDAPLRSGAIGRRLERRINPKQRFTDASFASRDSGTLSSGRVSGRRGGKVSGMLSSRITDKIVDAALKRSGADEQTKERVKYGMQFAAALAAGGPAGFAAALAQDVARRAGREIAERALEEAVERGHITAEMAEMAMRQVDRVAPNGLPDEVVDKLADAWSIGSEFLDERVFTEENAARAREIVGRVSENAPGSVVQATDKARDAVQSAASRVRGRFGRRRRNSSDVDLFESDPFNDTQIQEPRAPSTQISTEYDDPFADYNPSTEQSSTTEYDDPFADTQTASTQQSSTEYDDPFADLYTTPQTSAKMEFDSTDDFFSSGRKSGRAASYYNKEYQSRIGIGRNMPSSNRPVSGYVVHRSHDEEKKRRVVAKGKGNIGPDAIFEIGDNDIVGDGLTAFGEIELILRPDVSQRTAYGRGDSLASAHRPVMMNSMDSEDIADALVNTDGLRSSAKDAEAMLHLLQASIDKNFSSINAGRDEKGRMVPVGKIDPSERSHDPFEAHILGGFKKDEVEGIHYPYTRVQKLADDEDISDVVNEISIKGRLEKLGFTPEEIAYFYSVSDSSMINTPSMQKLREYRAAKKIKEKYEGMGIDYVRFAHPDGINIENPRTYDKSAIGNENVGRILQNQIMSEMDSEFQNALKKMRKPGARDVIS